MRKTDWTAAQLQELKALVTSGMVARDIAPKFGRTRKSVIDAVRRNGLGPWPSQTGSNTTRIPADFAELWQTNSLLWLSAHFECSLSTAAGWAKLLGLVRARGAHITARKVEAKPAKPAPLRLIKPNAYQNAPVNKFQRDMSAPGQAADFLRKFGPVYRCDVRGRPLSDGFFWRRGNAVMTDDELIERADWMRSKAA